MKYLLFICIALFCPFLLSAQKSKKVKAQYSYVAPQNISIDEAKRIATEQAQIQAIADEFGTAISQNNTSFVSNENGKTDSRFYSVGDTEVKGEWIETTKEPEFEILYEDNTLVVNVYLEGVIREIKKAQVDYDLKILRNGTTSQFENSEFKSGDDLFISFKSPINGYLAIYLLGEDDQAYCILPYSGQTNGIFEINANKNYILFSQKDAPENVSEDIVEELYLTCEKQMETNQIYCLFSPNPFSKCLDEDLVIQDDGKIMPRHLDVVNFHKWLAKSRKRDEQMIVDKRIIQIHK